jgi:hypothetical protein
MNENTVRFAVSVLSQVSLYLFEQHVHCVLLEARLSKLGVQINAFYQVPEGLDKPVGLRKYPHRLSARTGDVLIPGEVRESTQELYIDGVKFIKIIGATTGRPGLPAALLFCLTALSSSA